MSGLLNRVLFARQTLCLYHNWLQHVQIHTGPSDTSLWNFDTKSAIGSDLHCCISILGF